MRNQKKNNTALSREGIERYSRQILIPEIGLEGQNKLQKASVLIVGAGGLGGIQAVYLAAAGIGRIGIADPDMVELSNLQRQVTFGIEDVGKRKLDALAGKLHHINPAVKLDLHKTRLVAGNALSICRDYDIVIDGSDNFATRYLVNDVCVILKKPNIYGSVSRFDGQVSVFDTEKGPCYRCLYPAAPAPDAIDNCVIGGVLGPLPGIIGLMQSVEAVKIILGSGGTLRGRLLIYDAMQAGVDTIHLKKAPDCPVCGPEPVITEPIDYDIFCGTAEHDSVPEAWEVGSADLKRMLDGVRKVRLIDIREPQERRICHIEGAEMIAQKELPRFMASANKGEEIVLFCRSGIRSARSAHMLREDGFTAVRTLRGGILAWIEEIEPQQARY